MEEFTVEEIISYHIEIILASDREDDRGMEGKLLTPGNLYFVVEFSSGYSDPFERAAFILHSLAIGHAFIAGNKRIAFQLASLVLLRTPERYETMSSHEENDHFVRAIAEGKKTREEVETWLRSVTKKGC
ncbi:type II toxin-antitoxin system death-on-curing family toxin [Methanoculleus sp.]|uniref:type II toxin-antitoxin system death-on-curing family toxin n=1 Tax=Methanoculleus sp. TaxID=90427 RepID=UPI0025F73FE8|nr:type II toxin-antitoxin system death-on-curing family toxin [Methanoculleus sp.]